MCGLLLNKYLVLGVKGETCQAKHERKQIFVHKKMTENFDVGESRVRKDCGQE